MQSHPDCTANKDTFTGNLERKDCCRLAQIGVATMKMLFGTNTWNVIPTAVPSERHLRPRVPCECIMSESYPTLEMEAVLCCPHLFSGRPSLRTLAHTLPLRFPIALAYKDGKRPFDRAGHSTWESKPIYLVSHRHTVVLKPLDVLLAALLKLLRLALRSSRMRSIAELYHACKPFASPSLRLSWFRNCSMYSSLAGVRARKNAHGA